jgi:hypothetical protein
MKKISIIGFFLLSVVLMGTGAVQHNQLTNTNALHALHVNCYQGTYTGMAAVTNMWAGDCYQIVGDPNPALNGLHFEYQSAVPAPTPAYGTGNWVPLLTGQSLSPTWTFTPTWTITETLTPTPTGSLTPTKTATFTPSATGANTATNTPTLTPTLTPENTLTPVPGSDVIVTGFACDGTATGVTILGNRIQVTGISGVVPGDYVAFAGLLPNSANTLWPVVAATTNYFEVLTNQPGITNGGSADSIFDFRGNRCKNLNLLSGVTVISGNTYQFNFTDNQPDIYYGVELGSSNQGSNSKNLGLDYTMANNSLTVFFGTFSGASPVTFKGSSATNYFYMKLSGIQ